LKCLWISVFTHAFSNKELTLDPKLSKYSAHLVNVTSSNEITPKNISIVNIDIYVKLSTEINLSIILNEHTYEVNFIMRRMTQTLFC